MRALGRAGAGEQGPARPPLRPGALREGRAVSERCGRVPGPREQRFQAARSQTKAAGEGRGSGLRRRHLALLRAVRGLRSERRGARALCLLPASRRHDAWGAGGEGKEAGPARPLCPRAEATAPPACAPGPCTRAGGGATPGSRGARTPAPGPNSGCGAVGGAANTRSGDGSRTPMLGRGSWRSGVAEGSILPGARDRLHRPRGRSGSALLRPRWRGSLSFLLFPSLPTSPSRSQPVLWGPLLATVLHPRGNEVSWGRVCRRLN